MLHEAKILLILGKHPNIVSTLGLSHSKDNVYSILLTHEAKITLKQMFARVTSIEDDTINHIMLKLSDAIEYMHSKRVIHNNLITENICLRHYLRHSKTLYEPIIIGFSHATRMCSSRPLTIYEQEKFKEMMHLPVDVRQGVNAPSISSDMYSFKGIVRKFIPYSKSSNRLIEMNHTLDLSNPNEHFKSLVYHFLS